MPSANPLVDRIYEAAVIPELWRDACLAIADQLESYSASVISISPDATYRWISTPNIQEMMASFAVSETRFQNVRPLRALEQRPGAFTRDTDIMTSEELETDAIFREFIYPQGLKWTVGCVIQEPSGHSIVFDLMRKNTGSPFSDDDIARLNDLKSDLARAAFMTSRLAFREAQSVTSALSMVGLPAAVIGDSGMVIAMNAEMEAQAPLITTGAGNSFIINRPSSKQMFDEALQRFGRGDVPAVQSIPVAASDAFPATILHVLPVRGMARDVFGRSMALVIATPVGEVGSPDMRVLCGLFDLTPAEARLAREVATGVSMEAAAVNLGLSLETVRTYMKRVMAKTGTRRQAELAVLLSGLTRLPNISGNIANP
ncbi:MAG: DNA-binding protein with domain [Rhizobium sp.]|nr:DNA-binding protein with domain [Rhizobium sp.]